MYYDEFHNHKWARNLKHARKLLAENRLNEFYSGEDLPEGDVYPGMRVMAAYWTSVEHEMKLRCKTLLKGANHPEWETDPELVVQAKGFHDRYLADIKELVVRDGIVPAERIDALATQGWETPADWANVMRERQQASLAGLEAGSLNHGLVEGWFDSCLRSVSNYNRYLIWGGVNAAALVRREGPEALKKAVVNTEEDFMWDISREFFATILPAAGFEDIGDLMELGMRGMYADQWFTRGEERQEPGEKVVRPSILKNCELAGIYFRVAEWNGLPKTSLGYGICRYCEVHGLATMMITMPPMVSPTYKRIQSLGIDDKECVFELTTVPADDMERILMVQEKVFGPVE
jgi:hypothetical protein